MAKFTLKCTCLILVLFLGIIIGMQQANQGMKKMKGYDDPSLNSAFTVSETDDGEMEAAILGERVTSHDLEKKKEKLEEMKAFNLFSSLGRQLGDAISGAFQKLIDSV
ncbi:YqxA family protein [Bacillus massiliglaciei]|uniref:YqxA family protein n=1 Tax=Bacillus massiliglaciei TaxID=1816693 RepID=UPI000DA6260C|nr:YqxA family protein [Bacillus massiliglaciei]